MIRGIPVLIVAVLLAADAVAQEVEQESHPALDMLSDSRLERSSLLDSQGPGLSVRPIIDSALMLVGNINLAEDPEEQVDLAGFEVAPGIYAGYRGTHAAGFLDYSLIGRVWEDSDYNRVSHRLMASGRYEIVPEWFGVSGHASYQDAVIDPAVSYNYGGSGLFQQDNLSERAAASVTPYLFHDFRELRLDARYTYGRVWYLDTPDTPSSPVFSTYQDDSVDQSALVSLSTREDRREASMRLYYELQDSEYTRTVDYRYERAGAEVGFELSRTLRLVADGGAESDLNESTLDGGLDSGFWHAGVEWTPNSRTFLDARYGERYFGESWSLLFRRDTKFVTLRVSYSEDPTVETRHIGINFDPDEIPLPDIDQDLSGFTSYPYVAKDATVTLLADGARTRLRLDVYDRKRDYISDLLPGSHAGALSMSVAGRRLAIVGRRDLVIERSQPVHYYDFNIIGRINWEAYRNFMASAEAGYLHRSGERNYDGEWLALRLRYIF